MIAAWLPTDLLAADLGPMVADSGIVIQEKLDGVHVIAYIDTIRAVSTTNRNGQPYRLPPMLAKAIGRVFPENTIVDGEFLQRAQQFVAFDLLMVRGVSLTAHPYADRWANLEAIYGDLPGLLATLMTVNVVNVDLPVQLVRAAFTEADKVALLRTLFDERAEGIIVKRLDAPYTPGRPVFGGTMRRLKFRRTADLIIQRRKAADTKHSFDMFMIRDGALVNVGSVNANTLDPTTRKPFYKSLQPEAYAVAECSYLYASDNYRIVQPVLSKIRADKDPADCAIEQLIISKRFDAPKGHR